MRYIYCTHEGLTSILPLLNHKKVYQALTALACSIKHDKKWSLINTPDQYTVV